MRQLWLFVGRALFWLCWPALWIYLAIGRRTRVVLCDEQGRVLLVKGWFDSGRWQFPGGGLHRGETPEAGAVRELREELGITVAPSDLTELYRGTLRGSGFRVRSIVLIGLVTAQPTITLQRGEIVAADWLDIATIQSLPLNGATRKILALWQASQS